MFDEMAARASEAPLSIDFIVVGGGMTGLASAIALRRAGHRVLVLEKAARGENGWAAGIHLPPNLTKVLFHWQLKDALMRHGLVSHTMFLTKYATGEWLGTQVWEEEVLKEARGEVLLMTHRDLLAVLEDAARAAGATLRHSAPVVAVDPAHRTVRLASGELLTADVIVGADGPAGLCRSLVVRQRDPGHPLGISMYVATVAAEHVPKDLFSRPDIPPHDNILVVAFGSGRFVMTYPIGGGLYTLHYYVREPPREGYYGDPPSANMSDLMRDCEPRLAKMAQHASPASRIAIKKYTLEEDWVHDDGPLVLIGEAAHPWPGCTIQKGAMGIEDAAVLAKLFSHLSHADQIPSFLEAAQELRQPRVRHIFPGEIASIGFSMLPDGAPQAARDAAMRARAASGASVLDSGDSPAWDELRTTFGYDCEDAADDWWIQWGLLRERARTPRAGAPRAPRARGIQDRPRAQAQSHGLAR